MKVTYTKTGQPRISLSIKVEEEGLVRVRILNEIFEYRDNDLYWKVDYKKHKKGDLAGRLNKFGYREAHYNGIKLSIHRSIWELHNGPIPKKMMIDHRDRNPKNNAIENLRLCTMAENVRNRSIHKGKRDKWKGVHFNNQIKYWMAYIFHNGKQKNYYEKTEEDAATVYNFAAKELFGEFAVYNVAEGSEF